MTSTVAILALLATAPPFALTTATERIPLPVAPGALKVHILPFDRKLALSVPPASLPVVAKRLRGASKLCPIVVATAGAVELRCRSARLRVDVETAAGASTLVLRGLTVFPWRPQEEGPLLVPFDLAGLGLGACPGAVPEARGECLLAAGKLQEALDQFAEAARRPGGSPLASLRLGDLALASDEPGLAAEHWRRAAGEFPFGRLVTARLCELEPRCLRSAERPAFFDASLAAEPVRHDLYLRGARLRLLEGDRMGVLEGLVAQMSPRGACADVMPWCRRVLLDALHLKGPDGAAALRLYLEVPGRDQGPLAGELGQAAADQAVAAGAPNFAANLLASLTGRVPDAEQPAHLERVARLFLAGGDRARAEEIVLFAQARLDRATWRRGGWDALQKTVRALPRAGMPAATVTPPPATSTAQAAGTDPDVAMARAAIEAARAVAPTTGEHP